MYKIYKITSNHVVDFAAEELKKYMRMMMPRCGEIEIAYDPDAKDGYRLGLMQDFGLDVSEAPDVELDDIVHIDTDDCGGIIAGDNPRSVLFAVYKFLYANGCRWLFPGIDGEQIPVKDVEGVKYHKLADMRYRGQCNEGAEYQPNMMEAIDFNAKLGLNIFMIEFDIPKVYYDWYYDHKHNQNNREPEPITPETILQWKRQCEAEISKRGLQYHDMGHGWTAESFGISSTNGWVKEVDNPIPDETRGMLAEIDGVRELWHGVALNTNFCMSNPKARERVAKKVCEYAEKYTNVDYLHVWLADGKNNHCECDECKKMIPSDYYVMLMNEIDSELTARGLNTRIVFCCYYDTIYPAEHITLNNPDRFSILLGAITRSYTESVSGVPEGYELVPYNRNKNVFPKSINEYAAYALEWKKRCKMPVLVYEYHFWVNQYYQPGMLSYSKILHEDIKGYNKLGFGGTIQDGTQRAYFPNGFTYYVYGATLFDNSVDFEMLKEDYYSHAYGEDWREVVAYMEKLGEAFDHRFMTGQLTLDESKGNYYNPKAAESMRRVPKINRDFAPFLEAHKNMPLRSQTVSYRVLARYMQYCEGIAPAMILKAYGAGEEAARAFKAFLDDFGKHEIEIERYYDQAQSAQALYNRMLRKGEPAVPGL